MRISLAAALLTLFALGSHAQEPPVFPTEVELVQIEVRATDRDGEPVSDLELGDFVLEEDGQSQEIELFHFVGPRDSRPAPELAVVPGTLAPAAEDPQAYTWVYVATEVRRTEEFARAAGPLKRFVEESIRPGFFVSLGGLPFTDDKDLLLASLDRMVGEPLAGGSAVVDPVLDLEDDLAFEREVAASLQRQRGILTGFVGLHRDPVAKGRLDDVASFVSVERIDRQMIFYGTLALLRYLDLIERMAVFPGKKVVLLYRSGLRLEAAHSELLDQITATALRHRVSFFTFDSRGLDARAPVQDRKVDFAFQSNRTRGDVNPLALPVARNQSVNGLVTLAKTTEGRSVVDANDPGAILQTLLDESSNYYVLGYRPQETRDTGRFRKVRVSVNRNGVEVRAPRGYYEARPFEKQSGREKSIALYQALLSEAPADLAVLAGLSFFAALEGRTALVFSAGVRPGDLATKNDKSPELEATVLVSVRDRLFDTMPILLEQEIRPAVTKDFLEKAAEDETISLTYNGRIDLSPGRYTFKVLLRDDRSGRMGTFEQAVEVPSFSADSVPSSLLLTRQVQQRDESGGGTAGEESSREESSGRDLLEVGELRLAPEPGRVFRQGHVVYGVYHLYNASEADFVAADQGMQIALQRDGEWYAGAVSAGGQPFPDRSRQMIRFIAWLDTEKLPPGRYTMVAVLPNYQTREIPDLSEDFEVLAQ